ncbi:DUF397 domain-containing protein [Actinomadura sp. 9N407]|uniref:DUF397 domain-containing protein n=1 Tax=Actinomadura sp. 9N407 TaxID=3375154 RepID=UPI0037884312
MTAWRKSSYSQTSGTTDCVELAGVFGGVGVRDSKAPDLGHLVLSRAAFREVLLQVRAGELDMGT